MLLGELFLGILGNTVYDLSKNGLRSIFSGTAVEQAIMAIARDYPNIKLVHDALTMWCKSDEFVEKLESIQAGLNEKTDRVLVESFVEVGLFYDGLHNTYESAQRVLEWSYTPRPH